MEVNVTSLEENLKKIKDAKLDIELLRRKNVRRKKMRVTRFSDLNYEDKTKLTDEQVKDFIKVECAYTGVKLLPEPVPPVKPEMGEKTDYCQIGYNNDLTFLNAEDAEKVLKLLRTCDMVKHKYEEECSYVSSIEKFNERIRGESYYTAEQHEVNRDALAIYKKQKDAYDVLLKEWNKEDNALGIIRDKIYEEMQRVWELERTRDRVTGEFIVYLSMAKGDNGIALKFLNNSWDKEMSKLEKGLGKERYNKFLKTLENIKLKK